MRKRDVPLRLPCAHVTNLRLRTRAVSDRWYEGPLWQTVVLLHTFSLLSCRGAPSDGGSPYHSGARWVSCHDWAHDWSCLLYRILATEMLDAPKKLCLQL